MFMFRIDPFQTSIDLNAKLGVVTQINVHEIISAFHQVPDPAKWPRIGFSSDV